MNKKILAVITIIIITFIVIINLNKKTEPINNENSRSLILYCENFSMEKNSTFQISAELTPEDKTESIIWESSNKDVANINNGIINSYNIGTTTITAKSQKYNLSKTCEVTIIDNIIPVQEIKLNKTELTMIENEVYTLSANILPNEASNKNLIWSSDDANIAIVANGKITAKKSGITTITASDHNGEVTAMCIVEVIAKNDSIPIEKITLDKSSISLISGEVQGVNALIEPENATSKNILWTSENEKVAKVVDGIITATGKGTTKITASTIDGKIKASISVTVTESTQSTDTQINIENIKFEKTEISIMVNESYNLQPIIEPSNATNKKLVWKSSNEKVASVNEYGKVTGKSVGTAIITVSSENGTKMANATINVLVNKGSINIVQPTGLSLNRDKLNLFVGEKFKLIASTQPKNAVPLDIKWKSSNEAVATINENGMITTLKNGNTTITATSTDNSFTVECKVVVYRFIRYPEGLTRGELSLKLNETKKFEVNKSDRQGNIVWTTSDDSIATVTDGLITAKKYGTAIITATKEKITESIIVKVIPNVEPIDLNSIKPQVYADDIKLYQPTGLVNSNKTILDPKYGSVQYRGMQDFDIANYGKSNETLYFIVPVRSLVSLELAAGQTENQGVNSATKEELLTAMVYKVPKSKINDTYSSEVMYVRRSGQGQFLVKEPTGDYFWTSGNGGLICSGSGCWFDETSNDNNILKGTYYCSDNSGAATEEADEDTPEDDENKTASGKKCTWWGGNNANIARYKFATNTYPPKKELDENGNTIKEDGEVYFNYGTIQQKRITVWTAADWNNNLLITIDSKPKEAELKNRTKIEVLDATKAKEGKKVILYSFSIPKNAHSDLKGISTQGYAINGGYLYRLRGNHADGIWIEQFDFFGNVVNYKRVPATGKENSRAEAQGLKIYNNKIYLGLIYRDQCDLAGNPGTGCTNNQMNSVRSAIFKLN